MSHRRKKHTETKRDGNYKVRVQLLMAHVKPNAIKAVCDALCIVLVILSSTVSAAFEERMYLPALWTNNVSVNCIATTCSWDVCDPVQNGPCDNRSCANEWAEKEAKYKWRFTHSKCETHLKPSRVLLLVFALMDVLVEQYLSWYCWMDSFDEFVES